MPAPRGLVQQVDQELHRSLLLPRGARLLLGVSGGADSVAMLRLLHGINQSNFWRWTLVVGHVDHGIRGRASAADARFTKKLADSLGLRCVIKRVKLGVGASEDVARRARFRALKSMARMQKCEGAVLGHHADDQAETVLLRLFRGAGLEGLGGMAAETTVNELRVFRPLLAVRRRELRTFLEQIRQPFREDGSNATDQYLRNRVRKLIPQIERIAGGAVSAITRSASLARQGQEFIEKNVEEFLSDVVILRTPRRVHLDRMVLKAADPLICSEVLRWGVLQLGGSSQSADFERIREAVRLIQSSAGGKHLELGMGVHLHLACSTVTITHMRSDVR